MSRVWASRNSSGFYTILEDEMFGKGLTNIGHHNIESKVSNIIRSYGSLWTESDAMDIPAERVHMYLYESRDHQLTNLNDIDSELRQLLTAEFLKKLPAPKLQHQFATEEGVVVDLLYIWDIEPEPLFQLKMGRNCVKLAQIIHFEPRARSKYDFHVKIN